MNSGLTIGETGSGKSSRTKIEVRVATQNGTSVVLLDPHDSLCDAVASRMLFDGVPFLYDKLSEGRGIGWEVLPRHGLDADEDIRCLADIVMREQGKSLSQTPLIEEWFIAAVRLVLSIDAPFECLQYAFMPGHPVFNAMVERTPDRDLKFKFERLLKLNPNQQRVETGGPLRRMESLLVRRFRQRIGSVRIGDILESGTHVLVSRGLSGGISDHGMRAIMAMIIQQVIRYVKTRRRNTPRVLIVIDEATNAGLVDEHVARALAETRKFGLAFSIICQNTDFGSDELKSRVLNNCQRHVWFNCSSAGLASEGANDLAYPTLDPNQEHSRETSVRQLHDGFDDDRLAKYREFEDERIKYMALEDQIKLRQKRLMTQPVGVCSVKKNGRVFQQKVPLEKDPWIFPGLGEEKLNQYLQTMYQRPEFQSTGENAVEKWLNSLEPIEPSPTNSSSSRNSSRRERRLRGRQNGSSTSDGSDISGLFS